jgi:vacuolar-type H+-ATPase subunit E/Vma4
MSEEKIIEQIKKDSQKIKKQILKEAEIQASDIIKESTDKAKKEAEKMILNGHKQSESIKKILISKANQDAKSRSIIAKETIIEKCFEKAQIKLSKLGKKEYEILVTKLIKQGSKKLGDNCTVKISKDIDKTIVKKLGMKVTDKVYATGGIILTSSNGKIILDNTFDGILGREKDRIRIKVGKLLFS